MIEVARPELDRRDLDAVVELSTHDLLSWRDSRLLVTGATGFVGSWVVAVLRHANRELRLGLDIVTLARHPSREAGVTAVAADIRSLSAEAVRAVGRPDGIVHLACPNVPEDPRSLEATIVDGTKNVARLATGGTRFLLASSGAVHGFATQLQRQVPEYFPTTSEASPYGLAKRVAERHVRNMTEHGGIDAVVARLWAFAGPLLPLHAHFAFGNFVADALARRPIEITGNPRTVRSYLYPVDLVVWLLAVFTRGRGGIAYNVGSDVETTIDELATTIGRISGTSVRSSGHGPASYYVPDTSRARHELAVAQTVALDDAVARTLAWHDTNNNFSIATLGAMA